MPDVRISDTSKALLDELVDGMRREHPAEARLLQGTAGSDGEPDEDAYIDNAIQRVHRGFVGLPPEDGGPEQSTGPFRKWASDRRAEVLLRQIDPKTFRLAQPFRYDDGVRKFSIPEDDVTDLASVPRFLTWLVPRYGRHTLAALLHDHLQDDTSVTSEQADEIFRDAMGATGVPLVRRWVMWSAVALRTQWNMGGLRKARALLWVAIFGLAALVLWPTVLTVLATSFGWGAVGFAGLAIAGAAVVPLVLSVVWGRLWRLGALGGMALMVFTVPVVLVLFALGVYVAVEWTVERLFVSGERRNPVLTRNMSTDTPASPATAAAAEASLTVPHPGPPRTA
jgi:hypothetical protein